CRPATPICSHLSHHRNNSRLSRRWTKSPLAGIFPYQHTSSHHAPPSLFRIASYRFPVQLHPCISARRCGLFTVLAVSSSTTCRPPIENEEMVIPGEFPRFRLALSSRRFRAHGPEAEMPDIPVCGSSSILT